VSSPGSKTLPPSFAASAESCVTARSFSAALPAQYPDVSDKSYPATTLDHRTDRT
jgi:hypothetical protein